MKFQPHSIAKNRVDIKNRVKEAVFGNKEQNEKQKTVDLFWGSLFMIENEFVQNRSAN